MFKKMFVPPHKKQKLSSTGITYLSFSKGDNSWVFTKPKQQGAIKRKQLVDLYNEVISQDYKWCIENKDLFHNVIKEVATYQEERKKPFLQRKHLNFHFI